MWNDDDIYKTKVTLLSDKTIIINKNYFINSDSEEDQVYINAIFDSIVKSSEPVVLNNENILLIFFLIRQLKKMRFLK